MPVMSGRAQNQGNPGFQGSETTGVEITIYPQGGDPITVFSKPVEFKGRYRHNAQPSIVQASTNKMLGAPSGTFSFACKPGRDAINSKNVREYANSLLNDVIDDDWVDIVFHRHSRKWHAMRGLIRNVRRSRSVGGKGATSETFVFSGSDFGHIWESTPIWFNPYSSENLGGAISAKVFSAMENILGSPSKAVTAFLRDMLREIDALGRATWVLPRNLPNRGNGSFVEAVDFDTTAYPADLDAKLIGVSQNWLMPQGTLWQLAKEWSDPMFTELYCDLLPISYSYDPKNDLLPRDTQLAVIFREKPFPTVLEGREGPWFNLPVTEIPRQQVGNDDVGRSGDERFNAYFVSPQLTQELLKTGAIDMLQPLVDQNDISRHGFRRFDVMTKYTDRTGDILGTASALRTKVRDWYCLNPYLLNGSIQLKVIRPDIRIGTKIRIPGKSRDYDETYYVEQVGHNWRFGQGGSTDLGVTRGFIGKDDDLMRTLTLLASRYSEGVRAQPGV